MALVAQELKEGIQYMTKLTLHTNDKMKDQLPPKCTVQVDNEKVTYRDFIVVGFDDNTGHASLFQNTDALTLGIAQKLTTLRFVEAYNKLSEKEKAEVDAEIDMV